MLINSTRLKVDHFYASEGLYDDDRIIAFEKDVPFGVLLTNLTF